MRCSSIFEAISLNSDHEPIARTRLPLMTAAVVDPAEDRPRAASLLEFNDYNDQEADYLGEERRRRRDE